MLGNKKHKKKIAQIFSLQQTLIEPALQSTASAWMSQTSVNNRYQKKILNERRHVSFALMLQKQIRQKNQHKIKSLQHGIHMLDLQTKRMQLEGMNYHNKLKKLYQAQGLEKILYESRMQRRMSEQIDLERKQKRCEELRLSDKRKVEMARTNYHEGLKTRVGKLRQTQNKISEEKEKLHQNMMSTKRELYNRIKNEQKELKQRSKRIEQFKLRRARMNYLAKIGEQLKKREQNEFKMQELVSMQKSQLEALKKTKKLQKESQQIEKLLENFFTTEG